MVASETICKWPPALWVLGIHQIHAFGGIGGSTTMMVMVCCCVFGSVLMSHLVVVSCCM